MTTEQIKEAIEQMKSHCDLHMADYNMLSARGTLYTLGFHGQDAEDVLKTLHESGFSYCLDHEYKCSNGIDGTLVYPRQDVCYWGPDQLKSRLQSIYIQEHSIGA